MKLSAQNVSFSYGRRETVRNCTLTLETGKLTVITGPNGGGKSTLLHLLGGLLKPAAGRVVLDGREMGSFPDALRASRVGVLTQTAAPALDFSVAERVMMGRFAHLPRLFPPGEEDRRQLESAMKLLDVEKFADVPCSQLSGGEYQKVLIASLLVRETPVMLLDEPVSALDPAAALRVMKLLRRKAEEAAVAVISHDLALCAAFADELTLFHEGAIFASGRPSDVLTRENISAVYGCDSEILSSSSGPVVIFKDSGR